MEVLKGVLQAGDVKVEEVGIITPYDAQKRRIRNEINLHAKVDLAI